MERQFAQPNISTATGAQSGVFSLLKEEKLAKPKIQLQRPADIAFFVRVGVIEPDGFVAPYGPTQQIDVARNYWPFLLFLPLLLL